MLNIPAVLKAQFKRCLQNKGIPEKNHGMYKKWLRYYLDFCSKYNFPQQQKESLPHFLKKLQEKRQTKAQQEQAAQAVTLYYELPESGSSVPTTDPTPTGSGQASEEGKPSLGPSQERNLAKEPAFAEPPEKTDSASHNVRTGKGASWETEYLQLTNEIKLRHYSPKTLQAYTHWVRKFQAFTLSKSPKLLEPQDVKEFLTSLAVKHGVSASTQNQAFNGLLFFFRHVLHKEFGKIRRCRPGEAQTVHSGGIIARGD